MQNLNKNFALYYNLTSQKQSGLRSMMAGSRQGSGMMGLMSMFSMLNRSDQSNSSLHNSNPSHSQSTSTPSSQMSRLDRLLQASRNQDGATGGGNNEMADGEMYGMLQDICGKVTKIREAEKTAKAKKEVDRTGYVYGVGMLSYSWIFTMVSYILRWTLLKVFMSIPDKPLSTSNVQGVGSWTH